jgi:hypothetical protein
MCIDKASIDIFPISLRHYIDWQKKNAEDDIDVKSYSHFLQV